ncbi:hypothetical protein AB0D12_31915 [Streptomyces sp. NPDC048479]|uniref:hypothetical protein n=1 Tax=Streptomyces sp. NPDC048479 TaxID=3154725 RepID=UPI003435B562
MAPTVNNEDAEHWRIAMCDWLTANNVDPKGVPQDSDFDITTSGDGQRTIHYTAYVRTKDGSKLIDPDDKTRAWQEQRSAPCLVEPPAWLRIPGGPS